MAESKVIILTGASRGIGWAIAHYLLSRSHRVVVVARSEAPLRELEKQYSSDHVAILTGDLGADFTLGSKAVELAQSKWQRLDGVVINHGVLDPVKRVADSSPEEWRDSYNKNFFSAIALSQASIPALQQSKGRLIFTSSGAATMSFPTWGAYGSAKAAMNHLASTIANEEADITVLAIRPGTVDTEMQRELREKHAGVMYEAEAKMFGSLKKEGKLLPPEKPGDVIARLVLEAPKRLSGRFMQWDDEELENFEGLKD